jgi:hypothetical protein
LNRLFGQYFELIFWIAALTSLAITNPYAPAHFSLCPLKLLKMSWCPGCGLGHAISFLFHGNISSSFKAHWLGIPATAIILHRIFVLGRKQLAPGSWSRFFSH